jgi:hypothetical protein
MPIKKNDDVNVLATKLFSNLYTPRKQKDLWLVVVVVKKESIDRCIRFSKHYLSSLLYPIIRMLHNILFKAAATATTSKTTISSNTIMYYSSRSFLSMAAAALAVASTSNAFVQKSLPSARQYSSASTLNMVADDAKVIMVTGSSRGLGRSIALDIGSHGHKMIINYVSDGSKESADATVEAIKASGGDAVAIQADCK